MAGIKLIFFTLSQRDNLLLARVLVERPTPAAAEIGRHCEAAGNAEEEVSSGAEEKGCDDVWSERERERETGREGERRQSRNRRRDR